MEKHLHLIRPAGTSDFFAQEAEKYHQLLLSSDARMADFGKQEGIVAPDIERADMAQELVKFGTLRHETEQAIAADQRRIAEERTQLQATPEASPDTTGNQRTFDSAAEFAERFACGAGETNTTVS